MPLSKEKTITKKEFENFDILLKKWYIHWKEEGFGLGTMQIELSKRLAETKKHYDSFRPEAPREEIKS